MRTDITSEISAPVKVPRMRFCLWVVNMRLCPMRKVIRMIRPETLQVCADVESKCIRLASIRLARTQLPWTNDQDVRWGKAGMSEMDDRGRCREAGSNNDERGVPVRTMTVGHEGSNALYQREPKS